MFATFDMYILYKHTQHYSGRNSDNVSLSVSVYPPSLLHTLIVPVYILVQLSVHNPLFFFLILLCDACLVVSLVLVDFSP